MNDSPQGDKIQKVLAHAGVCSRRGAETLISAGRVKLNGGVVTDPAIRINPDDKLEVDGKPLAPPESKPAGLILYKKIGYVTSVDDPHNESTVYDLLPPQERKKRWLYAGRLDKNSEGLVLFTNSGELVQRLTHPSFKVQKHYTVRVRGNPGGEGLMRMERGLEIDGRNMQAVSVTKIGFSHGEGTFEVILTQGEKRQIRRMFDALGCDVRYLCRHRIGPVTLKGLQPGQCRSLSEAELASLIKAGDEKPKRR